MTITGPEQFREGKLCNIRSDDSAAGRQGLLERVREAHALELDREALCAVCRHRGKHHTPWGCDAVDCGCRVPLRLIRCVVVAPEDTRWRLTRAGWDRAELLASGVVMYDAIDDENVPALELEALGETGDVS